MRRIFAQVPFTCPCLAGFTVLLLLAHGLAVSSAAQDSITIGGTISAWQDGNYVQPGVVDIYVSTGQGTTHYQSAKDGTGMFSFTLKQNDPPVTVVFRRGTFADIIINDMSTQQNSNFSPCLRTVADAQQKHGKQFVEQVTRQADRIIKGK
jgi:hypothetical protein